MITIRFAKAWLRYLLLTALAAVIEQGVIVPLGWRIAALTVTGLAFVGVTAALYREWRAEQAGAGIYRYQFVHHTDRD